LNIITVIFRKTGVRLGSITLFDQIPGVCKPCLAGRQNRKLHLSGMAAPAGRGSDVANKLMTLYLLNATLKRKKGKYLGAGIDKR
jgi:hypothetical protein